MRINDKKCTWLLYYLAYPLIGLMTYYLFQAFSIDDKMIRREMVNRVLILGGIT